MSGLRSIPRIGPDPSSSPWIVRAESVEAHRQAHDIVALARSEAAQLREQAIADAERVREAARAEGLRDGAAAAAALVAEVSAAVDEDAAARKADIGRLAFRIAHRILGEFEESDRLIRAVMTALNDHHGAAGLRLRVSPQMEPVLRAALDQAGAGTQVTIDVNEGASSDSCTMIHPRGRIEVGPLDQLQALRAAVAPGGSA